MGARSEKILKAGDREVRILFTNRALAEAEAQLGKSVIALAQGFAEGGSGVTDIATLLRSGMEASRRDTKSGGNPVTLNDAYDVMDEVGFSEVSVAVMTALAEVLSYGAENQKN